MPICNDREYRDYSTSAMSDSGILGGSTTISEEGYIEGYATTFGDRYLLSTRNGCEYYETIDAGAFDDCDMSDVILQINHSGKVYARTRNNTIKLEIDGVGLKQSSYLNGTNAGRELLEEIRGGYYDRMSFGFIVGQDSFEKIGDNKYLRHVQKISKLFDVSVVDFPANPYTSCCARSLERVEEFDDQRIAECKAEAERTEWEKRRAEILGRMKGENL